MHHPRAADANAPVCAAGATTPEPDPGVEGREEGLDLPGGQIGVRLLCVEGESVLEDGRRGLDSPGGRIGVRLLTGVKFGDRMKKNIFEVFCA